jgi:hypothetical protein
VNANTRPGDRPVTIRRFTACVLWVGVVWNLAAVAGETHAFLNTRGTVGVVLKARHVDSPAGLPFLPATVDVGLNLDGSLDDGFDPAGDFAAAWGLRSVPRTWRNAGSLGMRVPLNRPPIGMRFAPLRC